MMRFLAFALCCGMLACASTPERPDSWKSTLDFAERQIAQGHASSARSALQDLRYREGSPAERARCYRLLGDANLALENWNESLDCYFAARKHAGEKDARMIRLTGMGIGKANQGLGRWHSADRHLEEALAFAAEERQRDEVRILLARSAVSQRRPLEARRWLGQVQDQSSFGFKQLSREAHADTAARSGDFQNSSGLRKIAKPASSQDRGPRRIIAPRIHARAEWGAQPLRQSGNPERMARPYRITIHHGGDEKTAPNGIDDAKVVLRTYQNWHFQKGWSDIGYHFLVDGSGRIWEGRSMRWKGAHAGSPALNRGNIGICCMGTFDNVEPSKAQKRGLKTLVTYLADRYGIRWNELHGHDEVLATEGKRATACPGHRLSLYLNHLRNELRLGPLNG